MSPILCVKNITLVFASRPCIFILSRKFTLTFEEKQHRRFLKEQEKEKKYIDKEKKKK